jgi:hypothetical protein
MCSGLPCSMPGCLWNDREHEEADRETRARDAAPACYRCENDEHDACGGPESGCGCAARGHE